MRLLRDLLLECEEGARSSTHGSRSRSHGWRFHDGDLLAASSMTPKDSVWGIARIGFRRRATGRGRWRWRGSDRDRGAAHLSCEGCHSGSGSGAQGDLARPKDRSLKCGAAFAAISEGLWRVGEILVAPASAVWCRVESVDSESASNPGANGRRGPRLAIGPHRKGAVTSQWQGRRAVSSSPVMASHQRVVRPLCPPPVNSLQGPPRPPPPPRGRRRPRRQPGDRHLRLEHPLERQRHRLRDLRRPAGRRPARPAARGISRQIVPGDLTVTGRAGAGSFPLPARWAGRF
jgi:hypothetical protein